jgi:serine/threonine protein kinase
MGMKSKISTETPSFDLFLQEVTQNDAKVIYSCSVWDADQRRMLAVEVVPARKNSRTRIALDDGAYTDTTTGLVALIRMRLRGLADQIPHHVTSVRMDSRGSILFWSADFRLDATVGIDYLPPSQYNLPSKIDTILRSELTEIERLGTADIVSYEAASGEVKRVVFKYYLDHSELRHMWQEIQILARLPPHPNLLPIDSLVVEEVRGIGVVGFTVPYILNGILSPSRNQLFKLKWLIQLTRIVDDLHFRFGIAHRAITRQNILINPETDDLVLSNFSRSVSLDWGLGTCSNNGNEWSDYPAVREDVKGVMFTLYGIVTRHLRPDWSLDFAQEMDIIERRKWIRHTDVALDHSVDVFYDTLMGWATGRKTNVPLLSHVDPAIWPLRWEPPPRSDFASLEELRNGPLETSGAHWHRSAARLAGREVVSWERPPKSKVDGTRRLLATGRYVEVEELLRKRRIKECRERLETQCRSIDCEPLRLCTPDEEVEVLEDTQSAAPSVVAVGYAAMDKAIAMKMSCRPVPRQPPRERVRRKAAEVAAMRIKATAIESGVFRPHRQRKRRVPKATSE